MSLSLRGVGLSGWLGLVAAALALGTYRLGLGAMGVPLDLRPTALGLALVALFLAALGLRRRAANPSSSPRRVAGVVAGGLALWTLGSLAAERLSLQAPEEVSFTHGEIHFRGTLYLPRWGSPPYPAVIITHGAGRETRQEGRYYARLFAKHGIAGLAFDKRGSGASGGDLASATYQDLAGDALAALRFLAGRADINGRQIGFWGVSEAGWVIPIAAAEAPDEVAFAIVVSTTADSPAKQVLYEVGQLVERAGHGSEAARRARELYARTSAFERTGEGREALDGDLRRASVEPWFEAARYLSARLPPFEDLPQLSWYPAWRKKMDFDAHSYWRRMRCPMLLLLGGRDPKIDAQNAARDIPALLLSGGNGAATVRVYPEGEHGLVEWWLPGRVPPPSFPRGYPAEMIDWLRSVVGVR